MQADRLNEEILSHLIGQTKSHYQQNSQKTHQSSSYAEVSPNLGCVASSHTYMTYKLFQPRNQRISEKQQTALHPYSFQHITNIPLSAPPLSFLPHRAIIYASQKNKRKGSQGELEQNLLIGLKPAHPRHYLEDSSPARVCSRPHPCQAGSTAPERCRQGPT